MGLTSNQDATPPQSNGLAKYLSVVNILVAVGVDISTQKSIYQLVTYAKCASRRRGGMQRS